MINFEDDRLAEEPEDIMLQRINEVRKILQKERREKYNKETEETTDKYKIEELVLKTLPKELRAGKFSQKWIRPYKIVKVKGKGYYLVENIAGKEHKVNHKDLQIFSETYEEWELACEKGKMLEDDNYYKYL